MEGISRDDVSITISTVLRFGLRLRYWLCLVRRVAVRCLPLRHPSLYQGLLDPSRKPDRGRVARVISEEEVEVVGSIRDQERDLRAVGRDVLDCGPVDTHIGRVHSASAPWVEQPIAPYDVSNRREVGSAVVVSEPA